MSSDYVPKPPPPDEINNSDLGGMKTLRNGLIMLAIILICFLAISRFIPGVLVAITPSKIETRIGNAFSKHPMIKKGRSSKKLNKILAKFQAADPDLKIHSISSISNTQENAFATIDKRVLVTSSLINNSDSEIALAFVIGHELGHIKHRHPLKSLYEKFLMRFISSTFGGGDSILKLSGDLASTSFSRSQESDADLYGLKLVHKAYGTVEGSYDFFERMQKKDKLVSLMTAGSLLSSHPLSKERIETLKKFAAKKGWSINKAQP